MAAGGAAAAPSAGGSAGPSAAGISDLGASSALAASSGALPRRAREGWGAGGACTAASGRVTRVSGGRACLGVAGATVTKTARACVSCAGRRLVFGRRLCVDMSEGCAASVGLGAHALWRRAGAHLGPRPLGTPARVAQVQGSESQRNRYRARSSGATHPLAPDGCATCSRAATRRSRNQALPHKRRVSRPTRAPSLRLSQLSGSRTQGSCPRSAPGRGAVTNACRNVRWWCPSRPSGRAPSPRRTGTGPPRPDTRLSVGPSRGGGRPGRRRGRPFWLQRTSGWCSPGWTTRARRAAAVARRACCVHTGDGRAAHSRRDARKGPGEDPSCVTCHFRLTARSRTLSASRA